MADNKDKCSKLLDKIFGSNFYFAHTTKFENIYQILKSKKIKIKNKNENYKAGAIFLNENSTNYAYCWVKYDSVKLEIGALSSVVLLLDPRILLHEDIIFNTSWLGKPFDKNEFDPNSLNITNLNDKKKDFLFNGFSIYLNKSDSKQERLEKLKRIKTYIEIGNSPERNEVYYLSHEFLFSKNIDLKKYLIGITFGSVSSSDKNIKKINKILEKKYKYVKIYVRRSEATSILTGSIKTKQYPKLLDVIC